MRKTNPIKHMMKIHENTFDFCSITGTSRIFNRVDEAMYSDLNEIAEEILNQVNNESIEHNIIWHSII